MLFWASIALVSYWAADRAPPFVMEGYRINPVKRGGVFPMELIVRRDVTRGCSVEFSRYMFDSRGFRYSLGEQQVMGAEGIARMEALYPGRLKLLIPIPESMAPGMAKYMTDLSYICNPTHFVWPIRVLMEVDFEVTP